MKQFIVVQQPGTSLQEEWISKIEKEKCHSMLFHIYCGGSDCNYVVDLMRDLRSHFPEANIVGTQYGGEICEGRMIGSGILISCFTFEKTDVEVHVYDNLAGNEQEIGRILREDIDARITDHIKSVELLLPGALVDTLHMYAELQKCDESVCIFGGYAGNHNADLENAFVFINGVIKDNAVIAIMYKGKDFHIDASKSAGWQRLGMPFKITKADGNILCEINDTPAAKVYKRYLNIDPDENFVNNTNEFPIAAYVDGEELLRHTNQVIEEKTLVLAGSVMEGWDMYLTYGDPTIIIDEVNNRLGQIYHFDPQAILLYSCYVRKLFWETYANIELMPFQDIAPTAGFNTFGEVLRNMQTGKIMEYNITLLSIAMREGDSEATRDKKDSPQADDTILRGQSSLVKRLAKLVSSSTAEIQHAYSELRKLNKMLDHASKHDALTGVFNRGEIEKVISEKIEEASRKRSSVSVIMLDIDHFKQIKDRYGHKNGDIALKEVASCLQKCTDEFDGADVGRWGGEEFMISIPYLSREDALRVADSIRQRIAEIKIDGLPAMTISVGVFTIDGERFTKGGKTISSSSVYTRIDNALYDAKNSGRNCVKEAYTY